MINQLNPRKITFHIYSCQPYFRPSNRITSTRAKCTGWQMMFTLSLIFIMQMPIGYTSVWISTYTNLLTSPPEVFRYFFQGPLISTGSESITGNCQLYLLQVKQPPRSNSHHGFMRFDLKTYTKMICKYWAKSQRYCE